MTAAVPARSATGTAGRRSIRVLVVVVTIVLLGELAARALGPHLPPTSLGDAAEMQLKFDRIRDLAHGPPTNMVIIGNSIADRGIDPAVMTATRPDLGTVYNAALVGAPLRGEARWARRFVLGRLRPDVVVLAVSPVDVLAIDPIATLTGHTGDADSGPAQIAAIESKFTETLDRLDPGTFRRIDDRLGDVSALVEHRSSLRHPVDLARAASDLLHGRPARTGLAQVGAVDGRLVPRDQAYWRASLTPEGYARELDLNVIPAVLDDRPRRVIASVLATTDLQTATLNELLQAVGGGGRSVVLAIIPPASKWLDDHHVDRTTLTLAEATIARQGRDAGATVVDLATLRYPAADYTDPFHLNRVGAARFSADLARALPRR